MPKMKQGTDLVTTHNPSKIIGLSDDSGVLVTTPVQGTLFHVERQVEFDDVEMGVLDSGVPYLTSRGLAKMCGVDHATLHRLTTNWGDEQFKPRGRAIKQILDESGYTQPQLFLKAELNGVLINAFTEQVCMAMLEYYAFVADERREKAISTFRTLARVKFREFVYQAVGYSAEQSMLDSWRHFHDRVDLTTSAVPNGYFCVFTQIAGMIVPMIRSGMKISDRVVPDISVGIAWSNYWVTNRLADQYGERIHFNHEYPDYYPQSKSNPQPAYAYPDTVWAVFQKWFKQNYLGDVALQKYLAGQVSKGTLAIETANKVLEVFGGKLIKQKKPANLPNFKVKA
jgi:hypothetical protein